MAVNVPPPPPPKKVVPTLMSLAYKQFNYKTITSLYKDHEIPAEILVGYFKHEKMYDAIQLYIRDFGLSLPPLDEYLSSVMLNYMKRSVERIDTTPVTILNETMEVTRKSAYELKKNSALAYNKFIDNYENDVNFRKRYKSKYKQLCDVKRLDSFLKVVY